MRKMESIVKRFYDELEAGRIMGRKCPKCGSVEFPPRIACTACGHFEMEWIEMSGRGQVTSFIEPSGMTGAQNEVFKPYVMGNVTTEEGAELNVSLSAKKKDHAWQGQLVPHRESEIVPDRL